jgi:hypothetical protein
MAGFEFESESAYGEQIGDVWLQSAAANSISVFLLPTLADVCFSINQSVNRSMFHLYQ